MEEKRIQFYGRRKGKKLKDSRERLMADFLDKVKFAPTEKFEIKDIFPIPYESYVLEIGFGGGEHIAKESHENKNIGFIGAEVFINGIASLLAHLTDINAELKNDRTDNVRIYPDDVRKILPYFKEKTFSKVYLLFPDPWPKTRHKARRFVNHNNLDEISRILKTNGELIIASDDMTYIKWTLSIMNERNDFEILWTEAKEYFTPPPLWIETRYELKALKQGKKPVYLVFKRN